MITAAELRGQLSVRSKSKESDTVGAILKYLDARGLVAERINSGMRVIKEGEKRHVFRGARAGTADILCCAWGVFLGIEVKRRGGRTEKKRAQAQAGFRARVRQGRGLAIQVYDVEEVARFLGELERFLRERPLPVFPAALNP